MAKSDRTSRARARGSGALANPVAKGLKDRQFRQRIVKSKVKYDRKRYRNGCDNLSHPFFGSF